MIAHSTKNTSKEITLRLGQANHRMLHAIFEIIVQILFGLQSALHCKMLYFIFIIINILTLKSLYEPVLTVMRKHVFTNEKRHCGVLLTLDLKRYFLKLFFQ